MTTNKGPEEDILLLLKKIACHQKPRPLMPVERQETDTKGKKIQKTTHPRKIISAISIYTYNNYKSNIAKEEHKTTLSTSQGSTTPPEPSFLLQQAMDIERQLKHKKMIIIDWPKLLSCASAIFSFSESI